MINDKYDIIKKINKNLKIGSYFGEANSHYMSRIIYSALSIWIRVSTLDENILSQENEKTGVSKIHIINRCKPFLNSMTDIFPEIKEWFYPSDFDENPIIVLRDRLFNSGELVNAGFDTFLGLPKYQECNFSPQIRIIRGINANKFDSVSGICLLKLKNKNDTINYDKIFEFYGLYKKTSTSFLIDYLNSITWNKQDKLTSEVFNKYSKKPFSSSWSDDLIIKNNEVTLYKNDFFDFGFVKRKNKDIYTSQISDYLIGEFEVRRFMYAFKKQVNNPAVAKYKRYLDEETVELHLFNDLPRKEQSILLLLGWPKKSIMDKFNLIFHDSVWELVKMILDNLNIELQEDE
ncbi:MAG: hypothetical protein KAX49_04865 [Halanaerobiales bacterium]|nr:hypothetical protein [Halanaerobiales bacterium]